MMAARYSESRRMGLRTLILPATLVAVVTALAVPCRAAAITFNPGAGSTGPITGVTGFGYATSSVLALGLGSPGTPGSPNTTPFSVYYESVINATSGTPSTIGSNFSINGSNVNFTVIAGFQESISSFSTSGSLTFALTGSSNGPFSTSPTAPNFFEILANPVGNTLTPSGGTGANFGSGTVILTGHVVPTNFAGAFAVSLDSSGNPTIGAFNNATSNPPTAITTAQSLVGGGGTTLTVQVDSANAAFFPTAFSSLVFTTTNSLPFTAVAPLSGFYNGPNATPNITYPGTPNSGFNTGTINAVNGNSLMFQSVATSSFAIPEPSSIIPAVTAALGAPMFFMIRRRRTKKSVA
jgi:hypothetical protein